MFGDRSPGRELDGLNAEAIVRTWYHFRSQSDPNLHSVTDDPTGDKLPAENSPWVLLHEVSPDREWTLAENKAVVAAGIAENGFYLFDEGSREPASSKPVIESDRVEGTAVYDPEGKQIGTIDRLLIEKVSGRVLHVDVTFGGFLGIGTRHHTIPW
jgi:PRC-barrel domain